MSDTTYTITKDPETGLQVVRHNGIKVGQTQSLAGARLIRRNHRRQLEAMKEELGRRETQSDRDAWYDMDR